MIQGDIVADDLGPGTDNPARVAAIRNRLSQLHPDGIPFLLLPVRIETRFMRVDRPTTTPSAKRNATTPCPSGSATQRSRLTSVAEALASGTRSHRSPGRSNRCIVICAARSNWSASARS